MESRGAPPVPTLPVPFPIRQGIGTLFSIGGSTTPQVVYDEFFRIAGGPNARVFHIPSATATFEEIADKRDYYHEFYGANAASFDFLHTYDRAVAEKPEFAEPLSQATGVWMGGGKQAKLAELFLNTEVVPAMHRLLDRGGIISGTSSGATIISDVMINRGYTPIEFGQGFALYPKAIIDTHYTGRERHQRVGRAALQYPDHVSIGIDERCALVVHGNWIGAIGVVGQSVWYHFADPAATRVHRYRLIVGESVEFGVPVRGADLRLVEEGLRAFREPDVFSPEDLVETAWA